MDIETVLVLSGVTSENQIDRYAYRLGLVIEGAGKICI